MKKLTAWLLIPLMAGAVATGWWNMWMYHGWIGCTGLLGSLIQADGEAAYNAMMAEMFIVALVIGPPVSSSLPPTGPLPFRRWLRVVGLSCCHERFSYKGLSPHLQRAHAGRTPPAAPYVASRRWCAGTLGHETT